MKNTAVPIPMSHIQNKDTENTRRMLISFFAMLASIIVLFAVGYLIKRYVSNPIDIDLIKNNFVYPIKDFKPERPERFQYMVLTVLFPILFFLFYTFFNKIKIKEKDIGLFINLYPVFLISIFILFCYTNIKYPLFMNSSALLISPMLAILSTMVIIYLIYIYHSATNKKLSIMGISCLIISLMATLFTAWLFVTNSYDSISIYNMDAYYDPIFQVYCGNTPTHDFNNQYGFYPYFFLLAFKLLGGISIFKFSVLLALLVLVTCLALLAVIWLNVQNKVLATVGYGALLFFLFYFTLIVTPGFYLAYEPHRLVFPSLIILVSCLWLRVKKPVSRTILLIIGYLLSFLSIIWNMETGVIVLGSWCLFQIYCYAHKHSFKEKAFYIQSLKTILFSIVSAAMALFAIMLITFLRCGMWPGIKDITFIQSFFYLVGFFMLPMKLLHPWLLVVFVYALGLMVSIRDIRVFRHKDTTSTGERSSIYFMISVLGMGLFSYFQGRSHDRVLITVCWPCILMIILFAQDCLNRLSAQFQMLKEEKSSKKLLILTESAKLFLIVGFLVSFALSPPYYLIKNETLRTMSLKSHYSDSVETTERLTFISECSDGAENIDLFISQPAYYYTKLGLKNPSKIDSRVFWLLKSDIDKVFSRLEKTQNMVFFDKGTMKVLNKADSKRFQNILNNRYILLEKNTKLYCYAPK